MLHMALFCVEPAHVRDAIVCYMDLETDSLNCLSGRIVEIAGVLEDSSCVFSTVVNPGPVACPEQPSVHGIAHDELLEGPCFAEAFRRFSEFLRYASLSALDAEDDSEDDQHGATAMKPDLDVMIVAHNGIKFDFPFLCAEVLRAGIAPVDMTAWVYVDTLDVLRVTDHTGECNKLQCAFRSCSGPPSLRAHRALDDCIALRSVVQHISASLGVAPFVLLRQFASRMDENTTCSQLVALLR